MLPTQHDGILKEIGISGYTKQKRLFYFANVLKTMPIEFAEDYARYRQRLIDIVRAGGYAEYGITEADIMEYTPQKAILDTIGEDGFKHQQSLLQYEKQIGVPVEDARQYVQYRQECIADVRAGKYAQFGITAADIVE